MTDNQDMDDDDEVEVGEDESGPSTATGRPPLDYVRKYFKYDGRRSYCTLGDCKEKKFSLKVR